MKPVPAASSRHPPAVRHAGLRAAAFVSRSRRGFHQGGERDMISVIVNARRCTGLGILVAGVLLGSAWAHAQSIRPSVTGVVTDSSGAVLPGVTVEVTSPALIERVRSAVTDGGGTYRIIELETGTYTVTFALPGFNTVRRDGIVLSGSMT